MSVEAWAQDEREYAGSQASVTSRRVHAFRPYPYATDGAGPLAAATAGAPRVIVNGAAPVADRRSMLPIETATARTLKRALDLVVGVPLFLGFLVLFPFIAMALKLTSRGPVLFKQVRVGRGGEAILVYKFRSMHIDAEERLKSDPELWDHYVGNGFKLPGRLDPRITAVGRLLRRTSLDELPQVVCVLTGSMSVVGPRPVVPEELSRLYGDSTRHYLAGKPGLTGLWQVSGRSNVVHSDRAELDRDYASTWTLSSDIRILVRTVPAVLTAHGAH